MFRFFLILIITTISIGILVSSVWFIYNQPDKRINETTVVIEKGTGSHQVANKLKEAGVVAHPLLFRLAARITGLDKKLKAGEYVFLPQISMREVLDIISKGQVHYRQLTLPEGLTTAGMIELINAEPNLEGNITIEVKEGELLPETYSFSKGESRNSIVHRAQQAMIKTIDEAWKLNKQNVLKNKYQLLVLASIIEKETGVASERADVAAVFINRLRLGMKLQTDPTVIYAITKGKKELGRPLYLKDLKIDSPYNTYKYYGLPPTPICNPGREALLAAANPSQVDYLYFVVSGEGGHRFARTLQEHNDNVFAYRKSKRKK